VELKKRRWVSTVFGHIEWYAVTLNSWLSHT
jgi:hypothetical protein